MKKMKRSTRMMKFLRVSVGFALMLTTAGLQAQPNVIGCDITKCPPPWWPEFGNAVTFTARVYRKMPGGGCGEAPPGIIHFELVESSSERGYSLNKGTRTSRDLHMNHPANIGLFVPVASVTEECDLLNAPHDHWRHVKTTTCVTEATVTVRSEDFGSYGRIRAWVEYPPECPPPGTSVTVSFLPREPGAPPTCIEGPTVTKIPRDDNGNDIADTWWGDATDGTSPTWDEETIPNPAATSKGDGLTRYEEWRGVHVQGNHTRLLTLTKELFIYRENAAWGAEDAAFTADIYFVTADEMNGAGHDPDAGTVHTGKTRRIINFNRTSHTKVDQHGLWLAVGGGDGNWGNWGLARDNTGGTGGAIGSPRATGRVEVYSDNISNACGAAAGAEFRYGLNPQRGDAQFSYDGTARRNEMIGDVIGHELGHGLNLDHHRGDVVRVRHAPGWNANSWMDVNSRPGTQSFNESTAGEATCVMAYNYHRIWQSVALTFDQQAARWLSSDPDWTPTVPVCAFGYGAGCTVQGGGVSCRVRVKIDDAD